MVKDTNTNVVTYDQTLSNIGRYLISYIGGNHKIFTGTEEELILLQFIGYITSNRTFIQ